MHIIIYSREQGTRKFYILRFFISNLIQFQFDYKKEKHYEMRIWLRLKLLEYCKNIV
jgi:hypothetical protein